MNIDVFNEATELHNKYKLCEELMTYLSNDEIAKGYKYKEKLAKFAETFKGEFMMFVHERMTACGEAFEELHDCDCDKQPETPTPPDESDDDKYEIVYGERVKVISGEYAGKVGTIIDVMVGFTKILVGLDDVEDAVEFTPDQLAKYTDPENSEEDGGTITPDEGE